ncbi:MAG TPA: S1 RNA-binding domain-containing protein [Candidatus Paceibacterota bacterium]|nr:S1 RNA-binding domain-containing protein [Candidatus Paceibacterota bacterium]HRZ34599.1 S1 RNA-binding domain-containing protein [Candidatus Paceibacterota bacterium]
MDTKKITKLTKEEEKALDFIEKLPNPPQVGGLVEGPVIAVAKAAVYIDLRPFGTGIIMGREYIIARDLIRKIRIGDMITAKVADTLNPDGYIELSLKEAKQALIWDEVEEAIKLKTTLELPVQDANKGGLLMSWQGIQGFLPASQLKPENYPRVMDGDKVKILEELKKLVGQKLNVTIIGATPNDGKLIFSEKSAIEPGGAGAEKVSTEQYKPGDILDGEVTGVVDFGIFVKIGKNLEGLVHISEIDWSLVENPREYVTIGEKVKVKVIEVKDGKVSLSIKALKENPWVAAGKKYKKGLVVKGLVIKYNKHGALVSIEEGVAGLVHVSEFENLTELKDKLELGKVYDFKITLFEAKDQKMTLTPKID